MYPDSGAEAKLKLAIPAKWEDAVPNYLAALRALDAEPTVLTEAHCRPEDWDGLLLPGGADLAPARYGQTPNGSLGVDEALDALQFSVLERFLRAGKPVLGICRGHQLLNVFFGGTLVQHLPTAPTHTGEDGDLRHPAAAAEGSFLYGLYGGSFTVNSSHHQATERPGAGLKTVAWAPDGTAEAAEHERLPIWSVQWHPERMCGRFYRDDAADGSAVLRFFLTECRRRRPEII